MMRTSRIAGSWRGGWCAVAVFCLAGVGPWAMADDAPDVAVKKSRAQICHPQGTQGYAQTKRFEPFETVEACLASGGRLPKGVALPASADGQDASAPVAVDKAVFDTDDPRYVRKSRGAVCYEATHGNYLRLLYYKAYLTMDDCVQSGGRRAGDTEPLDEQPRR